MIAKCLVLLVVLLAVAQADSRINMADPTARMLALGFPKVMPTTNLLEYLQVQFPHIAKNDLSNAGEIYRLETLILSLQERNTVEDRKALETIRSGIAWCPICTWVVNKILGKIESYGCSVAEAGFTAVCAAIPYVDVAVDICVEVLEWGCGKLASYIANGVTSPTDLCNDVFDNVCAGGSGSASSSSS